MGRATPSSPMTGNGLGPRRRLAYDNARIPEALIAAGAALGHDQLVAAGLRLLEWLVTIETRDDHYSFTPSGAGPGEHRPGYDQQPVETAAMADACARGLGAHR